MFKKIIRFIGPLTLLCCLSCVHQKEKVYPVPIESDIQTPCVDDFSGSCDSLLTISLSCLEIDTVKYLENGAINSIELVETNTTCSTGAFCEASILFSYLPFSCVKAMSKESFADFLAKINHKNFDLTINPDAVPFRMQVRSGIYARDIKVISVDSIEHLYSIVSVKY